MKWNKIHKQSKILEEQKCYNNNCLVNCEPQTLDIDNP